MRRFAAFLAVFAFVLALGAPQALAANGPKNNDTHVQLLAINDFHGNLLPPTGSSGRITTGVGTTVDAGGVEFLATHIKALRAQNPNTITVGAGDLIGASPLISALFHDEPTIESMNLLGLDVSGVGNHEFDEGVGELLRMQSGGCHPVDGCQDGDPFAGCVLPVPRGERVLRPHEQDDPAGVRDQAGREHEGCLHRAHARGDAADRHAGRSGGSRVPATRWRR